jgi:6-pyruvoyl-tetrahydropterin synthase
MAAHSLRGQIFGPAQKLHGATFTVEATFISPRLDKNEVVVDMGWAKEILQEILDPLNYQNLDALEEFKGKNTTTEYLAKYIHDKIRDRTAGSFSGGIKVILHESPDARAGYESPPPAEKI